MKNRFDEKVKGHGFFRKTKAFGLASGIALGAALLIGANTVSADEATPAQPTTTAQPTSSDTKTEVVTVKEAELKAKVDEAKKAGVEVVEKPAVSVGTATNDADAKKLEAEATKKVDTQIKALDDAKSAATNNSIVNKEIEEKKSDILNNIRDYSFSSAKALFDKQTNGATAPNLDLIGNFKSSKGNVDFVPAGEINLDVDNDSAFRIVEPSLNKPTTTTPTKVKFTSHKGRYANPEELKKQNIAIQEYVNKYYLNGGYDIYLVSLQPNEEITFDVKIPENNDLYKKYNVATVTRTIKMEMKGALSSLPPETRYIEGISPSLIADRHAFIKDANGIRRIVDKTLFDTTYTYTFKDKAGNIIPLNKLVADVINNDVFRGEKVLNSDDYLKEPVQYAQPDVGVAHRVIDSGYTNFLNTKLTKEKLTIQEDFMIDYATPSYSQFFVYDPSVYGFRFTQLLPENVRKREAKVEVSPVTYTRATAITTTYVPNDKLNPGETKVIDNGKQSGKKVIEVGTKPSEKVEETPFKEETRPNPALPEGERKVVQEGVKGRKVTRTTYTLDTKTGKVTPKEEVTENTAAKNRIVEVGTKKPDSVTEGELVTVYRPNDKLEAGKQNEVEPGKKSKLVNGKETEAGKPRIIEVGTKPVVMEKEIPFKETVVQNPSKPEGTRTVLKEGKVGKETTTTTYTLDTKTGKVTPDTKTTVVKAEDRLVEVGTGKNVTGDVETQYVPDPELEPGKTKVVQEGTPEVKDVTGKVLTPGKPTIIHIGTKPKVVEEELPFKEEVRENKDLPKGERKVVQEGKVGKKVTTTTYTLDTKTGKVTSEDKVEETAAVNKIIEVGTKEEVKVTPAPQAPAAPKAQLPHTGTEASLALTLAGLAVAGIATTMVRKKKEQ